MAATKKEPPPHVKRLVLEANSSDPNIAGNARKELSVMGRHGNEVKAKRRKAEKQKDDRQLALDIEKYRRASNGG